MACISCLIATKLDISFGIQWKVINHKGARSAQRHTGNSAHVPLSCNYYYYHYYCCYYCYRRPIQSSSSSSNNDDDYNMTIIIIR